LVGKRLPNRQAVPAIAAVLLVPMVLGNMLQFSGAASSYRNARATEIAELRLIESLRSDPRLSLNVQPDDANAIYVNARTYFIAIDRFGRPTLDYDWQQYVNTAAVEAARQRLLPGSK
jgi:hypothetical protein